MAREPFLSIGVDLGIYDAVVILGASFPALVVAARISNPRLRLLGVLLAAFLLLHGLYHLTAVMSTVYDNDAFELASIGLIQPLSYLVLFLFAYKLLRLGERSG